MDANNNKQVFKTLILKERSEDPVEKVIHAVSIKYNPRESKTPPEDDLIDTVYA
jgi:hypothetical protein